MKLNQNDKHKDSSIIHEAQVISPFCKGGQGGFLCNLLKSPLIPLYEGGNPMLMSNSP